MHDPRLVLSPYNDTHLTKLLLKYPGLTVTLTVHESLSGLMLRVSFHFRLLSTGEICKVFSDDESIDKAYEFAYLEFGMNTGLW